MSEKLLPFKKSPVIGFLGHAYVLGVLTNYEECMPWFYNNYIQLYISDFYLNLNEYWLDFFPDILMLFSGVPWLEYKSSDKVELRNNDTDINEYVMGCIDNGFYFSAYVDEFYVPSARAYKIRHYTHDIMIYGYNLEEKTFNFAGFDKNHNFHPDKISFENFDTAYNEPVKQKHQNYINMFRKIDNLDKSKCDFNLSFVMDILNDYLNSINSSGKLREKSREEDEGAYGMKIYEHLIRYIELLGKEEINPDIRPFHILWEHKKCMVMRLKYMQENGYMDTSSSSCAAYMELEGKMFSLRNVFLKYLISKDAKIAERIKTSLKEIAVKEQEIIKNMIGELNVKNNMSYT